MIKTVTGSHEELLTNVKKMQHEMVWPCQLIKQPCHAGNQKKRKAM